MAIAELWTVAPPGTESRDLWARYVQTDAKDLPTRLATESGYMQQMHADRRLDHDRPAWITSSATDDTVDTTILTRSSSALDPAGGWRAYRVTVHRDGDRWKATWIGTAIKGLLTTPEPSAWRTGPGWRQIPR